MALIDGQYPPKNNASELISGRSKWIVIGCLALCCASILFMEVVADDMRAAVLDSRRGQLILGMKHETVIHGLLGVLLISLTIAIVVGVHKIARIRSRIEKS
jgi:hypothetical protein